MIRPLAQAALHRMVTMHVRDAVRRGIVIGFFATFLPLATAKDRDASPYYTRCAVCHGKNAEGKSSTKAPSLVSVKVRKMSDEEIRQLIISRANGEMERDAAHTSLKKRLTESQIAQIISEIRKLQQEH